MRKTKRKLKLIHVEDTVEDSELLAAMLEEHFALTMVRVDTESALDAVLKQNDIDLILSDFTLPSYSGQTALAQAKSTRPDIPFIFFSGTIGEEAAVETLKGGATDYVLKQNPQKLLPAIERALRERSERLKRAEAESRYQSLFENSLEGICRMAPDLSLLTANPALAEMLGYSTPEELLADGRIPLRKEDSARIRELATGSGDLRNFQCYAHRKDRRPVWLELNVRTVPGRSSGDTYLDCFARDITKRVLDQEELEQQAALLNEAHDAIIVTDGVDIIRYWNKGAELLYGWRQDEVVGRRSGEIMRPPESHPEDSGGNWRDAERWEGELTHLTKDSREVVVMSRRTVLQDAAGQPRAILILNSDITEKKHTEAQFLRAQRLECIGALAGGIAHDLNNILAPILMGAELLKEHAAEEDDKRLIEMMQQSCRRGSEIVKQVLSFARGAKSETMGVDLKHLAHEVVKFARQTFPKSIQLQARFPEACLVTANPTELHQILLNLCVNARDAMPNGGLLQIAGKNVTIDAKMAASNPGWQAGDFVRLTVADNGTGIPAEALGKIFDPFYTTKEEGKGTGLGLATVLSIVKRHGGFVAVESMVGDGSKFHIHLPACKAFLEAEQPGVTAARRGTGEEILLVEDESAVLEMTRVVLEDANYKVTVASDGIQALQAFRRQSSGFRVVITDVAMPTMDGVTLVHTLRKLSPAIPIICSSGEASASRRDELKQMGVRFFVTKPYSAHQIVNLVADVINETRQSA